MYEFLKQTDLRIFLFETDQRLCKWCWSCCPNMFCQLYKWTNLVLFLFLISIDISQLLLIVDHEEMLMCIWSPVLWDPSLVCIRIEVMRWLFFLHKCSSYVAIKWNQATCINQNVGFCAWIPISTNSTSGPQRKRYSSKHRSCLSGALSTDDEPSLSISVTESAHSMPTFTVASA